MADNKVNSGLLEFSEDQKVFVALDAETSEVKKAVTIDGDGVETDIAGGGGGDVTVEALSVTENGTYSEEGKAYSPVTVNVAGDFYKPVINLETTGAAGLTATFNILPKDEISENAFISGVYADNEGGLYSESLTEDVTVGTPVVIDYINILNNHNICILTTNSPTTNVYTVEGDCTVKTVLIEATTMYYVEVYGDCSISVEGWK